MARTDKEKSAREGAGVRIQEEREIKRKGARVKEESLRAFKSLEQNKRKGNSLRICWCMTNIRARLQSVAEFIKMDYQGQTNGFTVSVFLFFF